MVMILSPSGRFRAESLFRPASVAVLGADTAAGGQVLANLLAGGFGGAVLPVAPDMTATNGVLAYRDVAALPVSPELAVLAVPADDVPTALDGLAARGCFAAICLGPADPVLLAQAVRRTGVRVVGPNAFGLCVPGLGLNASVAHLQPGSGRLALLSQSAALCRTVMDWAGPNGVGFSHVVGLGGKADIGFGLVLDWLSRDAGTGAILLDIRTVNNRRAFLSAARAAARLRPVVALRAGGRLTDPTGFGDAVLDAGLRRAGVLRVTRLSDLLAAAETLTRARPARAEALAIVTNAQGPGQMAADAATAAGIPLLAPSPAALGALRALLPGALQDGLILAGTGLAEAAAMAGALPECGGVLAILAPTGPGDAATVEALVAASATLRVPLLACAMGETTGAVHRQHLASHGVPAFGSPELGVRGFEHLVQDRRVRALARELPSRQVLELQPDRDAVAALLDAVRAEGRVGLHQDEALAVLAAYGLDTVATQVADGPDVAVEAADLLGYPVVVKQRRASRPQGGGKGGVVLDLHDAAGVRRAAALLEHQDGGQTPGLLVQQQAPRARELRLQVREDTLLGPAIGFGLGGTASDLLGDVAWDLPPLNLALAHALVARTRAHGMLDMLHDQPSADRAAVADALVRLSQLVVDFPAIAAVDLNPLFAGPDGVLAADAWIALRPDGETGVLAIAPYPAELTEIWQPRRVPGQPGDALLIRPIRPEDAEAHGAFFRRLAPDDVRFRFFSMLRELSAEQTARMTQVDYGLEMAFVAVRPATGETVGVCRLIREPYTDRGEFAVVVQPDMKGRGLARRLMQRLIAWGQGQGMDEIVGQILADNGPMLGFVRSLGFRVRRLPDDPEVVEAVLALEPATADGAAPRL